MFYAKGYSTFVYYLPVIHILNISMNRKILLFILGFCLCINNFLNAQSIAGVWQQVNASGNTATLICTENYLMFAVYKVSDKKLVSSGGGSFEILKADAKTILSFKRDFNTEDSTLVGLTVANVFTVDNKKLTVAQGPLAGTWSRIEEKASPTPLSNALWRLRAKENKDFKMQTVFKGPFKTIKIFSGQYFQWASFNIDTHQFFGTFGGVFSKNKDKYSEKINFSSKNIKEVGTSFQYDCVLNGKDWIHAGQTSKGERTHEIWEKGY